MGQTTVFLVGIGIMLIISLAIIFYMHTPLYRIFLDLFKTETQAHFWSVNSHLLLVLIPLLFTSFLAMVYPTFQEENVELTFILSAQLAYGFMGLIGTIVFQSLIIRRSIIRQELSHAGK